jgi:ketosteroid isomerase-like protein
MGGQLMGTEETLQDRILLRELAEAYALAADRRDDAAFAALFTDDALLVIHQDGAAPATFQGADGLRQATAPLDGYVATMHLVANHHADVRGDRATAVTYCHADHLAPADDGAVDNLHMTIRYDDRCVRGADGTWRFAARDLTILWTERRPATVAPLAF